LLRKFHTVGQEKLQCNTVVSCTKLNMKVYSTYNLSNNLFFEFHLTARWEQLARTALLLVLQLCCAVLFLFLFCWVLSKFYQSPTPPRFGPYFIV